MPAFGQGVSSTATGRSSLDAGRPANESGSGRQPQELEEKAGDRGFGSARNVGRAGGVNGR
jgi:hypothetical protein